METRMDKNGAKIDVGVVGVGMLVGMQLPALVEASPQNFDILYWGYMSFHRKNRELGE